MATSPTAPLLASSSVGQYLHAATDLRLESRKLEQPTADEVQIAIRSTALCGSDLHYFQHFRNGDIHVKEPLCLGHEAAGQIVALGSNAQVVNPGLSIGDAVALEVGVPCGSCEFCDTGRYNICPLLRFRGSGSKFPHYQGTLQERVNHPAKWVYKLPSSLSYDVGSLIEPLSVAVHSCRRAEAVTSRTGSKSCVIFGAGAVGLLCSVAAQASGWDRVVMVDIDPGRLQFALEHGFASSIYAVEPKRGTTPEEKLAIARKTASRIAEQTWPDGAAVGKAHVAFECTGAEACLQAAVYATQSGGAVLVIGLGVPNHILPISEATVREVTLIPTWRYANTYPRAIEIATASSKHLPDIRKLITHRFQGVESIPEAFKSAGKTKDQDGQLVVKTVVNF
ncbi:alcohol dehydrogenase GroES-like domain-containing protein [Colletotrichum musicola]|uniref:Alcohol dehydrogenase GroES-like domain-containing protein n=1 Tax=Colletotrichum musicola TaxID=2175873 RepID=A0A8H6KJZ6_9PEZI|nr:alcohol dehydrogenase GroES-like domain-containing protein [Colletotrichum musicola]